MRKCVGVIDVSDRVCPSEERTGTVGVLRGPGEEDDDEEEEEEDRAGQGRGRRTGKDRRSSKKYFLSF